jgi:acyl-CoA synthetase (NDP forming)
MVSEELQKLIHATCMQARGQGYQTLSEPDGKRVLKSLGVEVPRGREVNGSGDLSHSLRDLRSPLALKVVSQEVVHKSDFGAVKLGLKGTEDVAVAMGEIQAALRARGIDAHKFLIEEMAKPGVELVIGGLLDPEFGPMIMLGLGGIFVEVYKDVAFRICPINRDDAMEMIDSLVGSALLHGARGKEPIDIEALVDCLIKLGGDNGLLLMPQMPFAEIDINPFIATSTGATAVDARFVLKQV